MPLWEADQMMKSILSIRFLAQAGKLEVGEDYVNISSFFTIPVSGDCHLVEAAQNLEEKKMS